MLLGVLRKKYLNNGYWFSSHMAAMTNYIHVCFFSIWGWKKVYSFKIFDYLRRAHQEFLLYSKKKKKEYILLFQEIEQPTQLQILVYFCISHNLFSQFVAFTLWNNNYYLCMYCSYKIIYAFNSFVLKLEKLVCIRYHFVK